MPSFYTGTWKPGTAEESPVSSFHRKAPPLSPLLEAGSLTHSLASLPAPSLTYSLSLAGALTQGLRFKYGQLGHFPIYSWKEEQYVQLQYFLKYNCGAYLQHLSSNNNSFSQHAYFLWYSFTYCIIIYTVHHKTCIPLSINTPSS